MEFEGHITAELNVIELFKCHFRMHNLAIISFRKDMVVVQTMNNPYRMPNIDNKGLYTTTIPLSSIKNYEFDCSLEEVNVMAPKSLLAGKFKSKCINIVKTKPLGPENKVAVEVTFDGSSKCGKGVKVYDMVGESFRRHVSEPYPHFLIDSTLDYVIQEDDVTKLKNEEIQSVLVDDPKAFKSFYSPNFNIYLLRKIISLWIVVILHFLLDLA